MNIVTIDRQISKSKLFPFCMGTDTNSKNQLIHETRIIMNSLHCILQELRNSALTYKKQLKKN